VTGPVKLNSTGPAGSIWSWRQSSCGTPSISGAVETLRRQGQVIPDELLNHLAPLGWQHVNLTGDYLWGATASPGPAEFRELRTVIESFAA